MFVLMPEPVQNSKTILCLKQNYAIKFWVAFKVAYFCCFQLKGEI